MTNRPEIFAPFNPLDEGNLAQSVEKALLTNDVLPLGNLPQFAGAGIYAIYYRGDFPHYRPMSDANADGRFSWPIYAGKAIPKGARTGRFKVGASESVSLRSRLNQHAKSIRQVENLSIEDFWCRVIVVADLWIPMGEGMVITRFAPLWNTILWGFGSNAPGKGRHQGERSRWDTIHPGRKEVANLRPRSEPMDRIVSEVSQHLLEPAVPSLAALNGDEYEGK